MLNGEWVSEESISDLEAVIYGVADIPVLSAKDPELAPLSAYAALLSRPSYTPADYAAALSLNFSGTEVRSLVSVLEKLGYVEKEDFVKETEKAYQKRVPEKGEFSLFTTVDEKLPMTREELSAFEETLHSDGTALLKTVSKYNEKGASLYAVVLGTDTKTVRTLLESAKKLGENARDASVTAGYRIRYTMLVKGTAGTAKEQGEMTVVLVNGYWMNEALLDEFSLSGF